MGKAGRRKKNRQKRKEQADPLQGGADSASSPIANPQSAVHRLRHADPKTRHAALVALQASVLSQIRCGGGSRQVSMKVLQAVREQVTSSDLECSAVAADCLAQYLSATSSSSNSDQQKQTTASWGLVLLGRLEDCRKALTDQKQQQSQADKSVSKNQQKKAEKIKKQWYSVAAPCFIALCQLIEDNGHALDQINLQRRTFVEVVFGILALCLDEHNDVSSTGDDMEMNDAQEDGGRPDRDRIYEELRKTTELHAARSLHSALDDNWELAEVLESGESRSVWMTLLGGTKDNQFAATTRLHLIGCLVNLYQLSLQSENSNSWPEELLFEYGLKTDANEENQGLLLHVLLCQKTQPELFHAHLSDLEGNYRKAAALLEKQRNDEQLEAEVDAKVRERKEPAKLIAQRQKKVKEAKRAAFREKQKAKMIAKAEAGVDDADMMDADAKDDHSDDERANGKIVREQDGEDAVNQAMVAWTGAMGQIQLALEILANLVSTWIDSEDPAPQSKLFHLLQTLSVSSRLTGMLQTLSKFLKEGKTSIPGQEMNSGKSSIEYQAYEVNDPICEDLEETIGKVSACLVNCILSGITANNNAEQGILWTSLLTDLHSELENRRGNSIPNNAIVDAFTSVLVVMTETNPQILCEKKDGKHLFHDYITLFRWLLPRRDAVCLLCTTVLGLVSTIGDADSNTSATVRSITEGLMVLLTEKVDNKNAEAKNAVVNTQTQILKTFMDWYGNDSFYPQLYKELQVSNSISSCLMTISSEMSNLDVDEVQMEILHNSERFLEYKKNLQ